MIGKRFLLHIHNFISLRASLQALPRRCLSQYTRAATRRSDTLREHVTDGVNRPLILFHQFLELLFFGTLHLTVWDFMTLDNTARKSSQKNYFFLTAITLKPTIGEECVYTCGKSIYIRFSSNRNGITPIYIMPFSSVHGFSLPSTMTILRKKSPEFFNEKVS